MKILGEQNEETQNYNFGFVGVRACRLTPEGKARGITRSELKHYIPRDG